jgi:hypothetical protein
LERNENAVKTAHQLSSSTTTYPLTAANLDLIFKDKIHELAHIHNVVITYSLNGQLLKSSKNQLIKLPPVPKYILKVRSSKRYVDIKTIDGKKKFGF